MEQAKILQKIIKEDGNCNWADEDICARCPFSRAKTRPDGSYANCVEAIGVEGLSMVVADAKYKEAAMRALIDMQVDSTLEE